MAIVSEIENVINFDRQLSNLWELHIIDYDTSSSILLADISNRVKSVSLPFYSLDSSNTYFGKKFYNKVSSENMFTLDIWLDDKFTTYDYFNAWFNKVYNVKGGYFYFFTDEEDYKRVAEKTFRLTYLSNTSTPTISSFSDGAEGKLLTPYFLNSTTPQVSFELYNVKIAKIGSLDNDYEKGDGMSLKIDFSFDYVEKAKF